MLDQVEVIFTNMGPMMKKIKKAEYQENMEAFRNVHGHYFTEMTSYVDAAEDKEAAAGEVAECFTQRVLEGFRRPKRKNISGTTQADLNFFMVYYVFPALLLTEHEHARLIADQICEKWAKTFKNSKISYADYETIQTGFKKKLWGLF